VPSGEETGTAGRHAGARLVGVWTWRHLWDGTAQRCLAAGRLGDCASACARAVCPGKGRHLTSGVCPASLSGERDGVPVCRCARKGGGLMGSVIKKRRKRMAKKKHRKLLKKTRIQRRNKK